MKNWRDYLLPEDATIRDAIVVLEKNQCSMIVDAEEHILGTITDRDIRKALLKQVSLDSSICEVMNKSPTTLSFPLKAAEIRQKLGKMSFEQFPVVDSQQKVIGLRTNQELMQVRFPNTVVLMAGGLGSRLSPLTEECPKPLLKVGHQPVLETIIEGFLEHGFHRFVISVNYQSEMIENYFQDGQQWGVSIDYLREKEALGTAGALSLLDKSLEHPIIVINGNHEVVKTVLQEAFNDGFQNRLMPDFQHRLWAFLCQRRQPQTKSSSHQNHSVWKTNLH